MGNSIKNIISFLFICLGCITISFAQNSTVVKKKIPRKKTIAPLKDTLPVALRYAHFMQAICAQELSPQLYDIIDEWIGIPYRYGSNTKKGTDCSGFAGVIYRQFFNVQLPCSAIGIANVIDEKQQADLKEGDLLVFDYRKHYSHVGIYLQNGWFVHASTVNGVTLANLNSDFYQKKLSKAGSLKIMHTSTERYNKFEPIQKLQVPVVLLQEKEVDMYIFPTNARNK